jgi:thioredoxin 1
MTMSSSMRIDDDTFAQIEEAPGVAVIDFWAPWCGPCRILGPTIERLAAEYEGRVRVAKLNVDESPVTARRFAVHAIPSVLFFQDGELVDRIVGVVPQAALSARIDQLLETAGRAV